MSVFNKGTIAIVSGFSGTGKGTVMEQLLKKYDNYCLSISATTRKPREKEVNGREYFFKTVKEFEEMIANNKLIEYTKYLENYYGTPKDYVEEKLNAGNTVLLEIEIDGAMQIKKTVPEAILIFIAPPSIKELRERLINRGTESIEIIENRLARARDEFHYIKNYDYIVVNDDLEKCTEAINSILTDQHYKIENNSGLISKLGKELENNL